MLATISPTMFRPFNAPKLPVVAQRIAYAMSLGGVYRVTVKVTRKG